MPYEPPPELAELTLSQIAEQVEQRLLPSVEQWSPKTETDSLMRIAADGTWYHDGGEIKRKGMVRAFAGLLINEQGSDGTSQHWLVTPYEKSQIEVEDAAFIAVDAMERDGSVAFRLNTDELVVAGPDHPIIARGDADRPALYLAVRRGCEARLNRSTYEQLAEIALSQGDDWTVTSGGESFSLLPA